ncbi:Uncharacterized protein SCF082_LOCUS19540 [Durusdinium trenchii]|uniref:Uncharacterized protein n=1 Tax=Durusdinium trenchii TaxID=1381693 RepID=A0ABP0KWK7_9DINO
MPRSKLSAEEQLAELNRRASETAQAIHVKNVQLVLKNHPQLAGALWEKATSLMEPALLLAAPAVDASAGMIRSRQLKGKEVASGVRKMKKAQQASEAVPEGFSADQCFAGNVKTVGDIQIPVLKREVLPRISAVGLSAANVGAVERKLSKGDIGKIIEFATGVSPDFELVGSHRVKALFGDYLSHEHEVRGGRANQLVLPPDWASAGCYELGAESEEGLVVKEKHGEKKAVLIPWEKLPQRQVEGDKWCIIENHSETKAQLCLSLTRGPRIGSFFDIIDLDVVPDGESDWKKDGSTPRLARLTSRKKLGLKSELSPMARSVRRKVDFSPSVRADEPGAASSGQSQALAVESGPTLAERLGLDGPGDAAAQAADADDDSDAEARALS